MIYIKILFLNILISSFVFGQFEEVKIKIDTRQIKENDKLVFESLASDIVQYYTNNNFIDNSYELNLFIEIHLIIESYSYSNNNKVVNAQLVLTNKADQQFFAKGVDFPYSKGESIIFSPMFSPLASTLDFYAYLFIATELDTYDYLGGDSYFVKSDEIANQGRTSDYSRGWETRRKKNTKLKENRNLRSIRYHYFYIQDILNSDQVNYNYIISSAEQCVEDLNTIVEIYGNEKNTSLFLNIYGQYLAELFIQNDLKEHINLLIELNPENHSKYSKIFTR